MIYEYFCSKCEKTVDVIKSVSEYNKEETCQICNTIMEKMFTNTQKTFVNKEWPEYNPAFGKVIRGKSHRKEEAKIRGWEEIGNESPIKISKKIEQDKKDRWEKRWADA